MTTFTFASGTNVTVHYEHGVSASEFERDACQQMRDALLRKVFTRDCGKKELAIIAVMKKRE